MNRNVIITVLFMLSVALCSFGQTMSTANEKFPMPVVSNPINGFAALSTPTVTLAASAATQLPNLPAGTRVVYVCATNGAINFGGSDVAPGLNRPSIASGAYLAIPVPATKVRPDIYFCQTVLSGAAILHMYPAK